MKDGNGWTKWLVATLWGLLVLIIMFMGNGIVANDKESRKRDEEIISSYNKDMILLQKEINAKFETIMCQISKMNVRQEIILEKIKSNGTH